VRWWCPKYSFEADNLARRYNSNVRQQELGRCGLATPTEPRKAALPAQFGRARKPLSAPLPSCREPGDGSGSFNRIGMAQLQSTLPAGKSAASSFTFKSEGTREAAHEALSSSSSEARQARQEDALVPPKAFAIAILFCSCRHQGLHRLGDLSSAAAAPFFSAPARHKS